MKQKTKSNNLFDKKRTSQSKKSPQKPEQPSHLIMDMVETTGNLAESQYLIHTGSAEKTNRSGVSSRATTSFIIESGIPRVSVNYNKDLK